MHKYSEILGKLPYVRDSYADFMHKRAGLGDWLSYQWNVASDSAFDSADDIARKKAIREAVSEYRKAHPGVGLGEAYKAVLAADAQNYRNKVDQTIDYLVEKEGLSPAQAMETALNLYPNSDLQENAYLNQQHSHTDSAMRNAEQELHTSRLGGGTNYGQADMGENTRLSKIDKLQKDFMAKGYSEADAWDAARMTADIEHPGGAGKRQEYSKKLADLGAKYAPQLPPEQPPAATTNLKTELREQRIQDTSTPAPSVTDTGTQAIQQPAEGTSASVNAAPSQAPQPTTATAQTQQAAPGAPQTGVKPPAVTNVQQPTGAPDTARSYRRLAETLPSITDINNDVAQARREAQGMSMGLGQGTRQGQRPSNNPVKSQAKPQTATPRPQVQAKQPAPKSTGITPAASPVPNIVQTLPASQTTYGQATQAQPKSAPVANKPKVIKYRRVNHGRGGY